MQVFDTPGSVSLQIKLPSGRVVVTAAEEGRTSVELVPIGRGGRDALDNIVVDVEELHGRHVIRIEQKDRFRWGPIQITWGSEVEVRVACPPGTNLELSAASTDVRASGELGEVGIRTASGDVRLEHARGTLGVKTASGDVSVASTTGESAITTVSGDIEVGSVSGTLSGRAVSGDVGIGSLDGDLTLSTTSGDVSIRALTGGEMRVQTVSGDVRVGVGRGTRVWIDATSVSGTLESGLGIDGEEPTADDATRPTVPLHVKTVSGDVAIVSAAEVLAP
jgi:DUF4097 and DUF4098 domain-containing protein YvlB